MSRTGAGRILAEELARIVVDFKRVDAQLESLATERKRLAAVAQRLSDILRREAGPKGADRLLGEMGLSDSLAALPHAPGRVRGSAAPLPPTAPAASGSVLPKGSPVRMLEGLYKGWSGHVRWANVKGSTVTYTITLAGPGGKTARTQVAPRSRGTKWEIASDLPPAAPGRAPRVARGGGKSPPRRVAPPVPAEALPKGTAVRLLTGKFEGWTGVISTFSSKGRAITYAVNLRSPEGLRGRTQVNQGSLGRSWERIDGVGPLAAEAPRAPVPAGRIVRRRPVPVEAAPEPAPQGDPNLPPGILPPQTRVKMLMGHFLGFTGAISSVQARPGPRPDAIYSVVLTGPDGRVVRASVRHSSLGRGWTRLG